MTVLNDTTAAINALKLASVAAKQGSNKSGNVGTVSAQLFPANPARNWLLIKNDSILAIWINLGGTVAASAGSGNISINAGSILQLQDYQGAVNAISSGTAVAITAVEW